MGCGTKLLRGLVGGGAIVGSGKFNDALNPPLPECIVGVEIAVLGGDEIEPFREPDVDIGAMYGEG